MFIDVKKAKDSRITLFPNNSLNAVYINKQNRNDFPTFIDLLNNKDTNERVILNYINNGNYYLIGSLVKHYYYFGHHAAYIFPEFKLGNDYIVDFLVIGKNSDGYHFLLIELEAPYNNTVTLTGKAGKAMRAGINQIEDWIEWLESNYQSFSKNLRRYADASITLPEEFYSYDSTRFHYSVIVGRRKDFENKRIRRYQRDISKKLRLLHYDNIVDRTNDWISGDINRWIDEEDI